jgi:hypothetical protein
MRNHTPLQLRVSAEQVRRGFYRKLYGLQGLKSVFSTGAAWAGMIRGCCGSLRRGS